MTYDDWEDLYAGYPDSDKILPPELDYQEGAIEGSTNRDRDAYSTRNTFGIRGRLDGVKVVSHKQWLLYGSWEWVNGRPVYTGREGDDGLS